MVEDEELWEDDGSDDYLGWYCIRTDPFPCPAAGCTFVAGHMTAAHLVLVWEERRRSRICSGTPSGRWRWAAIPRVIQYEQSFGPSASYYAWEAAGRPVHGVRGRSSNHRSGNGGVNNTAVPFLVVLTRRRPIRSVAT